MPKPTYQKTTLLENLLTEEKSEMWNIKVRINLILSFFSLFFDKEGIEKKQINTYYTSIIQVFYEYVCMSMYVRVWIRVRIIVRFF